MNSLKLTVILSRDAWIGTIAEFIATYLFVYLGCASVVASGVLNAGLDSARLLVIAAAHGLAITALASAIGGLSGGHINPAVTLGMVLVRQMPAINGLMYIVAQFLGAVLGAGLLHDVLPTAIQGRLGAHGVSGQISVLDGVIFEVVMSFALIFVIFGTAVDPRGTGNTAPLAVGFTVLVDHLVGVPFTGASMNPARSLGPAVWVGQWDMWVYFVGPFFGAAIAAGVYTVLFLLTDPTQNSSDDTKVSLEKSSYYSNNGVV